MTKFLLFFENILLNYPGFCLRFYPFLFLFFFLPLFFFFFLSLFWFVANSVCPPAPTDVHLSEKKAWQTFRQTLSNVKVIKISTQGDSKYFL